MVGKTSFGSDGPVQINRAGGILALSLVAFWNHAWKIPLSGEGNYDKAEGVLGEC